MTGNITAPYTSIVFLGDFLFAEHAYNFGSTDHNREVAVFTIDRFHCTETFTVQSSKLGVKYYFVSSPVDQNTT